MLPLAEYSISCHKAMFGELYGEALLPIRCVNNRVYLSLLCLMYSDNLEESYKYEKQAFSLSVGQNEVQQILVHFGHVPSFVAIETSPRFAKVACRRIGREVLVPGSPDPKKQYIILALESAFKLDMEASKELSCLLTCITSWAKVDVLTLKAAHKLIAEANLDVEQVEMCYDIERKFNKVAETILFYKPGLPFGDVLITTGDIACLKKGRNLNEVIINFYLKYLYENILTPTQRLKTYIFNSYFYKRLAKRQGMQFSPDLMVRKLIKHLQWVYLFEKDFIIIPVNEQCHWFVAVICFPGSRSITEIEKDEEDDATVTMNALSNLTNSFSLNTERTTSAISSSLAMDSNKPEASVLKNVCSLTPFSVSGRLNNSIVSFSEPCIISSGNNDKPVTRMTLRSDTKQKEVAFTQAFEAENFIRPCILIFDSIDSDSVGHSEVLTNLRLYLTQEWTLQRPHSPPRVFDKSTMKGCYPKIPRQNNDYDGGVYLLQNIESFFTRCIKSFKTPVHLERWFTHESISKKREQISNIIFQLACAD